MRKNILILLSTICLSLFAQKENGAVCFTFDDYAGKNWLAADAIFKKYNAHATFFISGGISQEKAAVMKKLQDAGHTVGLHGLSHRNTYPLPEGWTLDTYFEKEVAIQLKGCEKYGIRVRGFAYPNNRRTDEIDQKFFQHFDFVRAGWGKAERPVLIPLDQLKEKNVLGGCGIGMYYKTDINVLKEYLKKAAQQDALIVFFSHDIYPTAQGVHMKTAWLEELLKYARELNMRIIGAEELQKLRK